jgi:hypothetical protein
MACPGKRPNLVWDCLTVLSTSPPRVVLEATLRRRAIGFRRTFSGTEFGVASDPLRPEVPLSNRRMGRGRIGRLARVRLESEPSPYVASPRSLPAIPQRYWAGDFAPKRSFICSNRLPMQCARPAFLAAAFRFQSLKQDLTPAHAVADPERIRGRRISGGWVRDTRDTQCASIAIMS